jgi:predicted AAA+ superfamily ATPase
MTYALGSARLLLREDFAMRGHLVESAVGARLLARGAVEGFEVFYWRDRGKEVDFVIRKGLGLTAIEVKSGRIKGLGGSLEFRKRYPEALSLIVGGTDCPLEDFLLDTVALFK